MAMAMVKSQERNMSRFWYAECGGISVDFLYSEKRETIHNSYAAYYGVGTGNQCEWINVNWQYQNKYSSPKSKRFNLQNVWLWVDMTVGINWFRPCLLMTHDQYTIFFWRNVLRLAPTIPSARFAWVPSPITSNIQIKFARLIFDVLSSMSYYM